MLEIEDIKVADLNKGEEPLLNGGTCVTQRPPLKLDLSVELKGINKELHEINKSLRLIAGRMK